MKIINKEEADKILTGKTRYNPVLEETKKLDVGEFLLIDNEDWETKTPPSVSIRCSFRDGRKFSIRQKSDKSGWLVERIK